jgi:hypothetical protein
VGSLYLSFSLIARRSRSRKTSGLSQSFDRAKLPCPIGYHCCRFHDRLLDQRSEAKDLVRTLSILLPRGFAISIDHLTRLQARESPKNINIPHLGQLGRFCLSQLVFQSRSRGYRRRTIFLMQFLQLVNPRLSTKDFNISLIPRRECRKYWSRKMSERVIRSVPNALENERSNIG